MSLLFPTKLVKKIEDIPADTKILTFYFKFNQRIKEYSLPLNLEELLFEKGSEFNTEINENVLPSNLRILKLGYFFNKKIKVNVLPKNLEDLYLGFNYNQEINEKVLPEKLKVLEFGNAYNKIINENLLPKNLEVIIFGYNYNQYIKEYVLPNSLRTIYFWPSTQINYFPENVDTIAILCDDSKKNNKKVTHLPYNLKKIIIAKKYEHLVKIPFGCEIINKNSILL